MAPRPCLTCNRLTHKTRCKSCEQIELRRLGRGKGTAPHHRDPNYRRLSKQLRAEWNANPFTTCWICEGGAKPDDPWEADHLYPSQPDSPLLPAHKSCNSARGARGRWSQ